MLAVVKESDGPGVSVRSAPVPKPAPGEALLRVISCGICGTDVGIYRWRDHLAHLMGSSLPVVLGHEFAGEVVELGEGAEGVSVGDRVVAEPLVACGKCASCRHGMPNLCLHLKVVGLTRDGGMSSWVSVPCQNLYPLPSRLEAHEAPLFELLGTGVRAVGRSRLVPGESAAVIGAGGVGLLLLQVVRAGGAVPLLLLSTKRTQDRLHLGKELGASDTAISDDPQTWERYRGRLDVVFEAAGTAEAIAIAAQLVRPGGRIVITGAFDEPIPVKFNTMIRSREVDLISSRARAPIDWHRSLQLVESGIVRLSPIVSDVLPMSRAEEAFRMVDERRALKIVLTPEN